MEKASDSSFTDLSLACHQNWPNFKGSRSRLQRSRKVKIAFFAKWLFANNLWIMKASNIMLAASCSSRQDASKYVLTCCLCQNLTSGQGHVRSHVEPGRSYCMSVDVSMRVKHTGIIPNALSLFYQKLDANKEFDRIWPGMACRRGHFVKTAYGPWRVA